VAFLAPPAPGKRTVSAGEGAYTLPTAGRGDWCKPRFRRPENEASRVPHGSIV